MNKHVKRLKSVFTSAGSLVWFIVSTVLIALLIAVTVLANGLFQSILGTVLGGPMPIMGPDTLSIYDKQYDSKEKGTEAGNDLNVLIGQEGFTLLLNENNALPIATSASKKAKVSVFGHNSVDLVLGGSGSGGISGVKAATLYDGLVDGNFEYNPTLKSFYESGAAGAKRSSNPAVKEATATAPTLDIGETPINNLLSDNAVVASFGEYSDAAIMVISRIGGESFDVPRFQSGDNTKHYLELDKNELDTLDYITSRFKKVIVVLNTLTAFQCDFIEMYNNEPADPRIDAVLWIGGPGATAAKAIGKLLNGEVNPSGKTVDIYAKDFTLDPTWQNFGDGSQTNDGKGNTAFLQNGDPISGQNIISYEEGMYIGYRYYETRAVEEKKLQPNSTWYDDNVVFPFGHGLSYTNFDQSMTADVTAIDSKDDKIEISVKVKNNGGADGKDIVQLYVQRPYHNGEIEKPHVTLVDFAKTGVLAKSVGEETITFTVDPYDLASYDYNDANGNGFIGYELDEGTYTFYAGKNSHEFYDSVSVTLTVDADSEYPDGRKSIKYPEDPDTGYAVENLYTGYGYDDSDYRLSDVTVMVDGNAVERKGMSRTDFEGTKPTAPTEADRAVDTTVAKKGWMGKEQNELAKLRDVSHNNRDIAAEVEKNGMPKTGAASDIKLRDLLDLTEGSATYGTAEYWGDETQTAKWNELLDKLTFDQMLELVNNGAFQTAGITSIGKNMTNDSDGPIGFVNFMVGKSDSYKNNTTFACQIVIGSTWNKDLAYRMGEIVGENGLYGDTTGNRLPYSGWYAPAVNLHRSPFAGRNFEYYSEDPILSGKLAVHVINAARTKGVYTDLKHFAVNDQETNRSGVSTFLTEQSLRELYLKPFEIAVKGKDDPKYSATAVERGVKKYVGTTGVMSSFNRIGLTWTGGDYRLMTEILRNEWGFNGLVICDYKTNNYMNSRQMLYAGNDLILTSVGSYMWNDAKASDAADVTILRKASHNILYTVANSNSIELDIIGYKTEWWKILIIVIDVLVPIGLAVWGFFAVRKAVKKSDAAEGQPEASASTTAEQSDNE